MTDYVDVVIIGAGISGVMAARTLQKNQITYKVVEARNCVGGRLATKALGDVVADYGAQFLTARTDRLKKDVDSWLEMGWIKSWFGEPNKQRYTGTKGMNHLVERLSEELEVLTRVRIARLDLQEDRIILTSDTGKQLITKHIILTPPIPKSVNLLTNSNLPLSKPLVNQLASISFNPCIVSLFEMDGESYLPDSGHIDKNLPNGIMRIVDHAKKGVSQKPVVTVYMKEQWSKDQYYLSDSEILEKVKNRLNKYIPIHQVISQQLIRWHYAQATKVVQSPFINVSKNNNHAMLVAGDAFLTPEDSVGRTRFESAYLSGVHAGEEIVKRMESLP